MRNLLTALGASVIGAVLGAFLWSKLGRGILVWLGLGDRLELLLTPEDVGAELSDKPSSQPSSHRRSKGPMLDRNGEVF